MHITSCKTKHRRGAELTIGVPQPLVDPAALSEAVLMLQLLMLTCCTAHASVVPLQALPTIILFKDGQPVDRIEGLLNEQQLFDRVSYYLAKP